MYMCIGCDSFFERLTCLQKFESVLFKYEQLLDIADRELYVVQGELADLEAVTDTLLSFISEARKSVRQGGGQDFSTKRAESLIERKGTARQISKEEPEAKVGDQ